MNIHHISRRSFFALIGIFVSSWALVIAGYFIVFKGEQVWRLALRLFS